MADPTLTPPRVAIVASVGVVVVVVLGALVNARAAVLALAVFALAGAVARIVTPATRAFAVRRRAVDVTVLAVLGLALGFLGLTTPLG
jgi:uncharacterized membrane protein